jgi:hypothetical protein
MTLVSRVVHSKHAQCAQHQHVAATQDGRDNGALLDSGAGIVFTKCGQPQQRMSDPPEGVRSMVTTSSTQGVGTRQLHSSHGPITLSEVALFQSIDNDIVSLGRLIMAGYATGAADGQIYLTTPAGTHVSTVLPTLPPTDLATPSAHIALVCTS